MLGRILAGTDVLEKSLDAALLRNEAIFTEHSECRHSGL